MPATLTDINRRLGELLPIAKDILRAMEKDSRRGHGGGGARVGGSSGPTDVSELALESTLSGFRSDFGLEDFATEVTSAAILVDTGVIRSSTVSIDNSVVQIDNNTDSAGGLTIAEWLEDIEADVDGIEGRLDTIIQNTLDTADRLEFGLIPKSAAEFLEEIEDKLGGSGALGILGWVTQFADNVITNANLIAINLNTDPAGGLTIAEWLEDIEADVDGIEGLLTTINASLNAIEADADAIRLQGIRGQGNVPSTTIPAGNTDLEARPAANEEGFIKLIEVFNNHAFFPVTFIFFDYDGTNQVEFARISSLAAMTSQIEVIDRRFQRDNYLRIVAGSSAAHTFVTSFLDEAGGDDTFTFTSPT